MSIESSYAIIENLISRVASSVSSSASSASSRALSLMPSNSSSTPSAPSPSLPSQIRITHTKSWFTFVMELSLTVLPLLAGWAAFKHMRTMLNPHNANKEKFGQQQKRRLLERLAEMGRQVDDFQTDSYEDIIINDIVMPGDITVTLDDIGGMEELKREINESIIIPLQSPELFQSFRHTNDKSARSLLQPPRGVLFYGPPGTGKTMMSKAIAHTCNATFIDVKLSSLEDKYYGETQKLIRALFSLATKLSPTIIFIDEIDMFFPKRSSDSSSSRTPVSLHGEFLTLMDGLTTDLSQHVMVLGATNRPFDLDEAILRRLPRTFLFDLPTLSQRNSILSLLLSHSSLSAEVSLEKVAKLTPDYSGSDLTELCKFAAMIPVRERIKQKAALLAASSSTSSASSSLSSSSSSSSSSTSFSVRSITMTDFQQALHSIHATGHTSYQYQQQFRNHHSRLTQQPFTNSSSSSSSASSSSSSSSLGRRSRASDASEKEDEEESSVNEAMMSAMGGAGSMGGSANEVESMTTLMTVMANYHLFPAFLRWLSQQRQQQLSQQQRSRAPTDDSLPRTNDIASKDNAGAPDVVD